MPPSEVENKNSKRTPGRSPALARSKRLENESLARIEKYARVLAPATKGSTTTSTTALTALANDRRAVTRDLLVESDASPRGARSSAARENGNAREGQMVRDLCDFGNFVRGLSVMARFGDLSRARLSLLRVQLCGEYAECDWIARPADRWDADLPVIVGKRNASTQALQDAIKVRALLFRVLPGLQKAEIRAFRFSPEESLELIVAGTVRREVRAPASVRSLVMRAKLFGLNFWLDEGVLEDMQPQECAVNS